jgi:serine/threonine protein kinase
MIGKTISHHKIIEKHGEEGMGEVYKAQVTKLARFVALKFLPKELSQSFQPEYNYQLLNSREICCNLKSFRHYWE